MEDIEIEYDNHGRMKYHPDFHFKYGQVFTEEEKAYLCRFYKFDGRLNISMALGKTEMTTGTKFTDLKKQGKYEYYYNLWEELS